MIAQPRQPLGTDVSRELDEVPDVELNEALAAGQDPQAFIAARNVAAREFPDLDEDPQIGSGQAMLCRDIDLGRRGTPDQETEAAGDEDLGMFGPDRPEPDDIRAGEDMSAMAWAEGSGEWPPSDPWVRRGLHNLLTQMTGELDVASRLSTDGMVTVPVSDLDNVLMIAVSALYEADARCG